MAWDLELLTKAINQAFDTHEAAAFLHVPQLASELQDNPKKAIDRIVGVYNKALDDAYEGERAMVESLAGGPHERIPWAVYNAVGAVYPYLDRDVKDHAVRQILNILDERNYVEVNGGRGAGHTTGIREPLLLSDICLPRGFYWPGLDEGKDVLKHFSFSGIRGNLMTDEGMFKHSSSADGGAGRRGINSDFVMAYTLLRSDQCAYGNDYLAIANPTFIDRTVKGIVALRFGKNLGEPMTDEKVEEARQRLFTLLPKSLHDRIDPLREEKDWIDTSGFRW
ncbi:hypothetical protein KW805_03240 [Candidatus Pacearchaeota archaeon]|nr:hypothetical protein [Candidatus Pacearchaeota archaeon]